MDKNRARTHNIMRFCSRNWWQLTPSHVTGKASSFLFWSFQGEDHFTFHLSYKSFHLHKSPFPPCNLIKHSICQLSSVVGLVSNHHLTLSSYNLPSYLFTIVPLISPSFQRGWLGLPNHHLSHSTSRAPKVTS